MADTTQIAGEDIKAGDAVFLAADGKLYKVVTVPFNVSKHAPADLNEENVALIAEQLRARVDAEGIRITAMPKTIQWRFDWNNASAFDRWHLAYEVSLRLNSQGHEPPFTVSMSSLEWADRPCDLRALWEHEDVLAIDGEMTSLGLWDTPASVVRRKLFISRRLMEAVTAFLEGSDNPAPTA